MQKRLIIGMIASATILIVAGGVVFLTRHSRQPDTSSEAETVSDTTNVNQKNVEETGKFQCGHDDPDLCGYFEKLATKSPYFLAGAPGKQSVTTATGNRIQYTVETDVAGGESIVRTNNDKETARLVIRNHTLYQKNLETNSWSTKSISDEQIKVIDLSYYVDVVKELADPKNTFERMRPEACGSLTCFHYRIPIAENSEGAVSMDIYFDTNEYLLRKVVGTYADRTEEFMPFYRYGTIEVPK